jgi:hypothetical protein
MGLLETLIGGRKHRRKSKTPKKTVKRKRRRKSKTPKKTVKRRRRRRRKRKR